MSTDFFVVGGTLRPNAASYVKREADEELFELTLAGELCYVLSARQMGKSSLMARTALRLREAGVRTIAIDLNGIGSLSLEGLYLSLLEELTYEWALSVEPQAWWEERASLGPAQHFRRFLREVVLTQIKEPVVIFIDEIDFTLKLKLSDHFLAAIRAIYNARAQDSAFERLTFVLLGAASPSDLIKERTRTAFNVGEKVALQDFSPTEAAVLQAGLEQKYPKQGHAIFARIYHWTEGHPYLTQKLCKAVVDQEQEKKRCSDQQIDDLVERLFLSDEAHQEYNLRFVKDQILRHLEKPQLLILYQKVYKGERVSDEVSLTVQNQLKLSGLVKEEGRHLKVRNRIYQEVFDLEWVQENIPHVSPPKTEHEETPGWFWQSVGFVRQIIDNLLGQNKERWYKPVAAMMLIALLSWLVIRSPLLPPQTDEPSLADASPIPATKTISMPTLPISVTKTISTPTPPVPATKTISTAQLLPTGVPATEPPASRIVVGSKISTEQRLLGKMLVLKLEDVGYEVIDQTGIGGTKPVREALEKGEIDLYWEYTGTALSDAHDLPPNAALSPDAALDMLRVADKARGLLWLGRLDFNNPYTLLVPPRTVAEKGIETIEELAAFVNAGDSLKVCGDVEFMVSSDGFRGLQEHYGFQLKEEDALIMSFGQIYEELREGECDVGVGLSTDGRIPAGGFHELSDTKEYFAFYHPALVSRQEVLAEYPALEATLSEFLQEMRSRLDRTTMSQLNACVDLGADGKPGGGDEMSVEEVARAFLEGQRPECLRRKIVVGSETQTEPLLLRKILAKVLQDEGYSVVEKTLPNRQAAREAIKEGEIDLYWGFTGLALSDDHQIPTEQLPTDFDVAFEIAYNLDENHYGLLWLTPAAFNKTYALLVQPSTVEQGLVTLDDLAQQANNQQSLKICVSSDFYNDPTGLQGLQEHYGFEFGEHNILAMPLDETYTDLRQGRCDVAQGLSTDGRIDAWGFHRLEDTKHFFAANVAAPVIRQALLDEYPELAKLLAQIGLHLDSRQMSRLNAEVQIGADGVPESGDEEEAQSVAHRFVEEKVMPPPQIVVGSQEPLVQSLLGKILLLVLEDAGYEVVEQEAKGTEAIRDAILEKEIDLYWELTGSALTGHHGLSPNESTLLSGSEKEIFDLAKTLDSQQGLVWLEPANFNQTYTLIVLPETAEKGMTTLEEIAELMNGGSESEAEFKICVSNEFYEREHDGLFAMQDYYGFKFKEQNILSMPQDETYSGLRDGRCQVAQGLSMDTLIDDQEFHELEDSRRFFPFNLPAPVIREALLEKHPELERLLSQIGPQLDEETVTSLNRRVDVGPDRVPFSGDEESVETVARSFLCQSGLLNRDCGALCEELLFNGGFEGRGSWGLPPTSRRAQLSRDYSRSGDRALLLGITHKDDDVASHSVAEQRISIPKEAKSATLSYWYYPLSKELDGDDIQSVLIDNSDQDFAQQILLGQTPNQRSWTLQEHDLSRFIGQEIYLYFYVINDGNGRPTAMYLDDVSLQACYDE